MISLINLDRRFQILHIICIHKIIMNIQLMRQNGVQGEGGQSLFPRYDKNFSQKINRPNVSVHINIFKKMSSK